MSGSLHAPRLGYEQSGNECAAVRLAIQQAEQACKQWARESDADHERRKRKAIFEAASEAIHRTIWPQPRVGMISAEYPDEVHDTPDTWARAGLAHGILDFCAGRGCRALGDTVPAHKRTLYQAAYFVARASIG